MKSLCELRPDSRAILVLMTADEIVRSWREGFSFSADLFAEGTCQKSELDDLHNRLRALTVKTPAELVG